MQCARLICMTHLTGQVWHNMLDATLTMALILPRIRNLTLILRLTSSKELNDQPRIRMAFTAGNGSGVRVRVEDRARVRGRGRVRARSWVTLYLQVKHA